MTPRFHPLAFTSLVQHPSFVLLTLESLPIHAFDSLDSFHSATL